MVLDKIARYIPDVQFLGFRIYYEYHWSLFVESKSFPYHIAPMGVREAIPLSALIKDSKTVVK